MIKKTLLIILLVGTALALNAQHTQVKPLESGFYLKLLESSKDSLYQQIISTFDNYLSTHPEAYDVMISRCEVIDQAFYSDYEEYNPNYEESEKCASELIEKFPNQLEVILFKAAREWGDEKLETLDRAIDLWSDDSLKYDQDLGWKLYEQRAIQHSYNETHFRTMADGVIAMEMNDTLDLSKEVATAYMEMNETDKAVALLLKFKEKQDLGWNLSQKGQLFLKLNESTHALDMFLRAQEDTSYTWFDKSLIAKAFVENGRAAEARPLFKTEAEGEYASLESKIDLFMFDLKYSQADSLKSSYNEMVEASFWHDPFGKFRIQMFLKAPGLAWSFNDLLRVLLFLVILAACLLIPYLWVLPVFSLGVHLKSRGKLYESSHQHWRLRQFWLLSALILMAEVITVWLFGYRTWVLDFNSEYWTEDLTESALELANSGMLFFSMLLIGTLFFIRRTDYSAFWGEKWSAIKSIGIGISALIIFRLCWGFLTTIYRLFNPPELPVDLFNEGVFDGVFLSVVETIQAINSEYHPLLGLFWVVILVPLYEEFIFRGVFLSAIQRHIGFFWANVMQATMFALVHDNLDLFFFYLGFGMTAGYLRKKSDSLAPGIVMHMVNNLLAFASILILS